MPTVTHAEAGELLAAYALDAVTDDERREIDAHVATCATCADELARHREAAGLIAQTELPTPSGQWERIEAAIGERPQVVSRARRRRTLVAAAVVATVAAAAAAALTFVLVDDADKEQDLAQVAAAAADEPGAQRVALETVSGETAMEAVVLPDGRAYVLEDAMGVLPEGRTYQLWGLAGNDMISLAVLGRDPGVLEFEVPDGTRGFAVTEEQSSGSVRPTGLPVASGELS